MSEPITLSWELDTPAPLERAWALLSDTDQFNQVAGLGFRFEDSPQPDGTVKRVGRARFLGTEMSWDEIPFQYRAPEWFRCTRRFHGTPASEVTSQLRLRRNGDRTEVRYSISVQPRGFWAVPLVWGELQFRTRPKIDHALSVFLATLSGGMMPAPLRAPALGAEPERRLSQALSKVQPPELSQALASYLRIAPLRDQSRMSPVKLAREWGLDEEAVIRGMLTGVREGALSFTWELLCPACQGPSTRLEKLADPGRRVHCTSCNVYYDATFPDSVSVSFRPSPAVRALDVAVECAGSPGRQPHIVASERLAPGEQAEITLMLQPGAYRVRTWPPLNTASLEVHPSLRPTSLELVANAKSIEPPLLRAQPGELTLRMRNDGLRALDVVLEKRERSPDVLTAGRLLEMSGVKDLLPANAIDPSFQVEVMRATALLVPADERNPAARARAAELIAARGPRRFVPGERGTLGIWPTAKEAWSVAAALLRAGEVGVVVATGPLLDVQLDEAEAIPMGAAVDDVIRRMPLATPAQAVVPEALLADEETLAALKANGLSPVPGLSVEMPGAGKTGFVAVG